MGALKMRIRFVSAMTFSKPRRFSSMSAGAPVLRCPAIDQVSYFNNSTMMEVDFVPEHLIVIGGSYIGLEFAQMYRRFGSEVTSSKWRRG